MGRLGRWLVVGCLLGLPGLARKSWGEETWREVTSPHFRVVTDGSEKDGRRVAAEFEEMRYVFEVELKQKELEPGAPLTIFAVRDGDSFGQISPAFKKVQDQVGGEFVAGWEVR